MYSDLTSAYDAEGSNREASGTVRYTDHNRCYFAVPWADNSGSWSSLFNGYYMKSDAVRQVYDQESHQVGHRRQLCLVECGLCPNKYTQMNRSRSRPKSRSK